MTSLGRFIHKYRVMRQVPLKVIAINRSVATLSRWEKGTLDVSSDVLGDTLTPVGIDVKDLLIRKLLFQSDMDAWSHLAAELWDSVIVTQLRDHVLALRVPEAKNSFVEIAVQIIDELLRIHAEADPHLRPRVVEAVTTYVQSIHEYSKIEAGMIEALIEYAPVQTCLTWITPVYQAVMKAPQAATQLQVKRLIAYCGVVANAAVLAPDLEVMEQVVDWMSELKQLIPEDPIVAYNCHVVEALYDEQLTPNSETKARLVAVVKAVKYIDPPHYYTEFSQYMIAQGWLTAEDFARTEN